MVRRSCGIKKCKRRIEITAYECKCKKIFCTIHRDSFKHDCTYNYRKEYKKFLEKQNPKIENDKIVRI